jgi:DNA-damage-inducible protein D
MSDATLPMHGDSKSVFESIKRINEFGSEQWSSRDLARVLDYDDYRNFEVVVEKAKTACQLSGQTVEDHFGEFTDMVTIGSNTQRAIKTVMMSRYACYLAIQSADPSKPVVAHGQTYFAVQTRKQEISEQEVEDERRVLLRDELRDHNTQLAASARDAGVVTPLEYAIFQNYGYAGLYGGKTAKQIAQIKGLRPNQPILDHMGSAELAANLFRATQTDDKLKRDRIRGKDAANKTHQEVGQEVRKLIKKLGGTMPEDLPPAPDVKKVERQIEKKKSTKRLKGPDSN